MVPSPSSTHDSNCHAAASRIIDMEVSNLLKISASDYLVWRGNNPELHLGDQHETNVLCHLRFCTVHEAHSVLTVTSCSLMCGKAIAT